MFYNGIIDLSSRAIMADMPPTKSSGKPTHASTRDEILQAVRENSIRRGLFFLKNFNFLLNRGRNLLRLQPMCCHQAILRAIIFSELVFLPQFD